MSMTQEEMTEEQRKQVEELVNLYVTNEAKLYEDWGMQIEPPIGRRPIRDNVGEDDTLEIRRNRFKTWCHDNLPTIRKFCHQDIRGTSICKKWKALQNKSLLPKGSASIATELVCYIQGINIPFSVTLEVFFTGLVLNKFLDALCDEGE
jgi:hypothetical protein